MQIYLLNKYFDEVEFKSSALVINSVPKGVFILIEKVSIYSIPIQSRLNATYTQN